MSTGHIILLPKNNYFKWVKACQKYVLSFGVSMTPHPEKAGTKEFATVANYIGGYAEGNITDWLKAHYPELTIDELRVSTPDELKTILDERVDAQKRFGDTNIGLDPRELGIELAWPTDYVTITQAFGVNPQDYMMWGLPGHEGIDFRAPWNSNIYACADGEVFYVEYRPDQHPYGIHVRIQHANGFRTVYAHLQQALVQAGDHVVRKQVIGKADSTGNSTGSHLHLTLKKEGASQRGETIFDGDVVDPTPYLIFPGT